MFGSTLFVVAASVLSATQVFGAAVPIPDNDPFYKPPSGFASSKPGTIYKTRTVASGLSGVTATQVLYRTNDANLDAAATVATILVGPKSSSGILVSYQDYEDAVNTTCSPSYLFSTGNGNSAFGPTFGGEVTTGLDNGWTIVIPDYEGIKSAFAAGHLEGYAVLDGIRAAFNAPQSKLKKTAVVGGMGYSGGALATSWAAALQANYAPELNVKGWAFGGTPANTTSTLTTVDGGFFAGFGAGGTAGLIAAYPGLAARAKQILTPAGTAALKTITSQCALADILSFSFQTLLSTKYQTLGNRLTYDPTILSYLKKNVLGVTKSETPKAPVYMYHSDTDEVIPYWSAKYAATQWCANGATVNFTTATGGTGHAGTLSAYEPDAIAWLDLRVKGHVPPKGCSYRNVSTGGIPLKREVNDHTVYLGKPEVLEKFGVGDEKIIATMKEQQAAGGPVDSFWSFVRP